MQSENSTEINKTEEEGRLFMPIAPPEKIENSIDNESTELIPQYREDVSLPGHLFDIPTEDSDDEEFSVKQEWHCPSYHRSSTHEDEKSTTSLKTRQDIDNWFIEKFNSGEIFSCVDEEASNDLSFATRYPNFLGDDFLYLKHPKQDSKPQHIVPQTKPEYPPWRQRAETSSKEESSIQQIPSSWTDIDTEQDISLTSLMEDTESNQLLDEEISSTRVTENIQNNSSSNEDIHSPPIQEDTQLNNSLTESTSTDNENETLADLIAQDPYWYMTPTIDPVIQQQREIDDLRHRLQQQVRITLRFPDESIQQQELEEDLQSASVTETQLQEKPAKIGMPTTSAEEINWELETEATRKLLQELTITMALNNPNPMSRYKTYEEYRAAEDEFTAVAFARENERRQALIWIHIRKQRLEGMFRKASGEKLHVIFDPHITESQPNPSVSEEHMTQKAPLGGDDQQIEGFLLNVEATPLEQQQSENIQELRQLHAHILSTQPTFQEKDKQYEQQQQMNYPSRGVVGRKPETNKQYESQQQVSNYGCVLRRGAVTRKPNYSKRYKSQVPTNYPGSSTSRQSSRGMIRVGNWWDALEQMSSRGCSSSGEDFRRMPEMRHQYRSPGQFNYPIYSSSGETFTDMTRMSDHYGSQERINYPRFPSKEAFGEIPAMRRQYSSPGQFNYPIYSSSEETFTDMAGISGHYGSQEQVNYPRFPSREAFREIPAMRRQYSSPGQLNYPIYSSLEETLTDMAGMSGHYGPQEQIDYPRFPSREAFREMPAMRRQHSSPGQLNYPIYSSSEETFNYMAEMGGHHGLLGQMNYPRYTSREAFRDMPAIRRQNSSPGQLNYPIYSSSEETFTDMTEMSGHYRPQEQIDYPRFPSREAFREMPAMRRQYSSPGQLNYLIYSSSEEAFTDMAGMSGHYGPQEQIDYPKFPSREAFREMPAMRGKYRSPGQLNYPIYSSSEETFTDMARMSGHYGPQEQIDYSRFQSREAFREMPAMGRRNSSPEQLNYPIYSSSEETFNYMAEMGGHHGSQGQMNYPWFPTEEAARDMTNVNRQYGSLERMDYPECSSSGGMPGISHQYGSLEQINYMGYPPSGETYRGMTEISGQYGPLEQMNYTSSAGEAFRGMTGVKNLYGSQDHNYQRYSSRQTARGMNRTRNQHGSIRRNSREIFREMTSSDEYLRGIKSSEEESKGMTSLKEEISRSASTGEHNKDPRTENEGDGKIMEALPAKDKTETISSIQSKKVPSPERKKIVQQIKIQTPTTKIDSNSFPLIPSTIITRKSQESLTQIIQEEKDTEIKSPQDKSHISAKENSDSHANKLKKTVSAPAVNYPRRPSLATVKITYERNSQSYIETNNYKPQSRDVDKRTERIFWRSDVKQKIDEERARRRASSTNLKRRSNSERSRPTKTEVSRETITTSVEKKSLFQKAPIEEVQEPIKRVPEKVKALTKRVPENLPVKDAAIEPKPIMKDSSTKRQSTKKVPAAKEVKSVTHVLEAKKSEKEKKSSDDIPKEKGKRSTRKYPKRVNVQPNVTAQAQEKSPEPKEAKAASLENVQTPPDHHVCTPWWISRVRNKEKQEEE